MTEALRPYQEAYVRDHALDTACYVMWCPRLGKTRAESLAMLRRIRECRITRTLVIGPKKALTLTWEPELRALGFERPSLGGGPNGYLVPMQHTVLNKTQWCAQVLKDINTGAGSDRPMIVLFNYEMLERRWDEAKKIRLSDLIFKWAPQDIVVDEAHLISTAGALRSQAMRRLSRRAYFRRNLSGTPDPNGWLSFYSQFTFLAPEIFGTNKAKFLQRYFIVNPFVAGRVEGVRPEHLPELQAKVFSIANRVVAKDYYSVEDPEPFTRIIPWPQKARALYDRLAQASVLTEEDDEIVVDGTHLLTKLLRFYQLCEGFLTDEVSGETKRLHSAKAEAIAADLGEILVSGKRAVVSFLHTPDGHHLVDVIAKAFGREAVGLVDGHTENAEDVLRLFDIHCTTETPMKVLVVQERAGGVGISLARAEHLLFSSWSTSHADHEQMRKRVWDPSRPCFVGYYSMADSADTFRRAVVKSKREASVMVTNYPWFDIVTGRI